MFDAFVLMQVPLLCHDPEGPPSTFGVDPGHPARWEGLHMCLQYQRGPDTLLWYCEHIL